MRSRDEKNCLRDENSWQETRTVEMNREEMRKHEMRSHEVRVQLHLHWCCGKSVLCDIMAGFCGVEPQWQC
jgi:hypothetical protein